MTVEETAMEEELDYQLDPSWPAGIGYYKNPWHDRNFYIQLELEHYDIEVAEDTFAAIRRHIRAPLQIMVWSHECEKIAFIRAAGFELKRRCFELSVSRQGLKKPLQNKHLLILDQKAPTLQVLHDQAGGAPFTMIQLASGLHLISRVSPQYDSAVRILYDYYRSMHENINPLTTGLAAFSSELPHHAIIDLEDDSIRHLAFIEENEIAYLASNEPEEFSFFVDKLLSEIFSVYEEICFEADDIDPLATILRLTFHADGKASYDTYIQSI
mgnify:CR=1 FL=1